MLSPVIEPRRMGVSTDVSVSAHESARPASTMRLPLRVSAHQVAVERERERVRAF